MVQDVLFNPSTSFNPSTRCGILWNQKVRQVPVPVDPRQWTPMAMARSILRQSLVLALGSSGILWELRGISLLKFQKNSSSFFWIYIILYHFISFYTDIYTLQPNAQRWRGLRMFTRPRQEFMAMMRGDNAEAKNVVSAFLWRTMCCYPKHPGAKRSTFLQPFSALSEWHFEFSKVLARVFFFLCVFWIYKAILDDTGIYCYII